MKQLHFWHTSLSFVYSVTGTPPKCTVVDLNIVTEPGTIKSNSLQSEMYIQQEKTQLRSRHDHVSNEQMQMNCDWRQTYKGNLFIY